MAIDPRISLMGQPSNIRQAVMGGLEIGEELRNRGVRDNILRQSEQVNQMNIAQAQGKYKYQLFSSLKSVPIEQRAALFAQQMPMLEQMGITGMPDLSDQGLDQQIMATKPFMAQDQSSVPASMQEQQWQASVLADPNADPALKAVVSTNAGITPRATVGSEYGQVQQMPDGTKVLYDLKTNTITPLNRKDESGNIVPLSPEEQIASRVSVAGQVAESTETGKISAEVAAEPQTTAAAVNKQKALDQQALASHQLFADIDVDTAGREQYAQSTALAFANGRSAAIEAGTASFDTMTKIIKMDELLDGDISPSGMKVLASKFSDFFGTTAGDVGQFKALGGGLVAAAVKQLGANPSDADRQFLIEMSPGLGQSEETNRAMLKDLIRLYDKQQKVAALLIANPQMSAFEAEQTVGVIKPSYDYSSGEAVPIDRQEPTVYVDPDSSSSVTDYTNGLFGGL